MVVVINRWKYFSYLLVVALVCIIVINQWLLMRGTYNILTSTPSAMMHADAVISASTPHASHSKSEFKAHSSRSHHSLPFHFTTKLINRETNAILTCNPYKYRYIELLLTDLRAYNLRDAGHLVTSASLDETFEYRDGVRWFWLRRARIQIINGTLYTNNAEIGERDEEGYRTSIILYLKRMLEIYGAQVPDVDYLWHFHDKKGSMNDLTEYDWKNISQAPIFVSDFNEASLPHTRTLYMVPRGWLKYRFFADFATNDVDDDLGDSKLFSQQNIRRVQDYLEFRAIARDKPELLQWRNKSINKAVFRGYLNNGFSRKHFFDTLNLSDIRPAVDTYFDAEFTTEWANTAQQNVVHNFAERDQFHKNKVAEFEALHGNALSVEQQLRYRYQINIDGYGVRDNLYYQMLSGSVILKQLSTLIEFWYFDLTHDENVIVWENILDLINVVIKLVDSMDVEHRRHSSALTGYNSWILKNWRFMVNENMTTYNDEKLRQITENAKTFVDDYLSVNNMDCFFIHMLEIYNYYFFDVNTLRKQAHPRLTKVYTKKTPFK